MMLTINQQLIKAAQNGDTSEVERLLDEEANIETTDMTSTQATALIWAAYTGHFTTAELLLKRKANSMAKDTYGNTPLHWAMYQGHDNIIQLLLNFGVDKTVKNNNKLTPIEFAYTHQKETINQLTQKVAQMEQSIEQLSSRLLRLESYNQHNKKTDNTHTNKYGL